MRQASPLFFWRDSREFFRDFTFVNYAFHAACIDASSPVPILHSGARETFGTDHRTLSALPPEIALGVDMRRYELRFLDKLDAVVWTRYYTGGDELDALAEAERQAVTHTVEVWEGARKVARVKRGNVPLASTDRLCG